MKRIISFCAPKLRKHWLGFAVYLSICFIGSISSQLIPYVTGNFIDRLLSSNDSGFILNYALIGLVFVSISLILGYFANIILIRIQTNMSFEIYKEILSHVNNIPLSKIYSMNMTAMNQRVSADINSVVSFSIAVIQNISTNMVVLVVSFVLVFSINKWFALLLAIFCALYYLSNKFFKRKVYAASYKYKEQQIAYFAKTNEQYTNVKFVKEQGLYDTFSDRLREPYKSLLKSSISFQKTNYMFGGVDKFLSMLLQIMLIYFSGSIIMNGNMTIGEFTIVNSYMLIASGVVKYFYNLGKDTQNTLASLNRLYEIIRIPVEKNGDVQAKEINRVDVKNLSFGYTDKLVLNNVNFTFERGKIYSITGRNGAGKSTLVSALLGMFNDEFDGCIYFNGRPISDYDLKYLRKSKIGYSEQNPHIIAGTIMQNISLKDDEEDASLPAAILQCLLELENVELDKHIDSAEDLSGGEKLRVALARTLYKNPSLLILDEPTSMLDLLTIEKLVTLLNKLKHDRIIIIVTHDDKLISISDEIVRIS